METTATRQTITPDRHYDNAEVRFLATAVFPSQEAVGKAIGRVLNFAGKTGGWIYRNGGTGSRVTQGWASVATQYGVGYDREAKGYVLGVRALRTIDGVLTRKAAAR